MRILLGVTGCIGAYKAPEVVRRLRQVGVDVKVVLTRAGAWFVAEGALQTVSGHPVYTDLFAPKTAQGVEHVDLAREADLLLVAPATANVLAKFAGGLADDFLTTAFLAFRGPVLVAPGMNTGMYEHPAVQHNIELLASRGVEFIGPAAGELACGEVGAGRVAEPEQIVAAALARLQHEPATDTLRGRRVLVTSGPTREPLDPVRFISNPSSGRMGHAVAAAARQRGATVVLVTGPVALPDPAGVEVVRVVTAREMRDAVLAEAPACDVVIMAAAVGDYEAGEPAPHKMKKTAAELTLRLTRTPDILAELGQRRGAARRPVLVGFAAETEDEVAHARAKLESKNVDYMLANRVDVADAGFEAATNRVILLSRAGAVEEWPLMPKTEVAARLVDHLAQNELAAGHDAVVSAPGETA